MNNEFVSVSSNVISGRQLEADKNITFANNALINTQVTIDFLKPKESFSKYIISVYNPSTVTDLTCKVFSIEENVDTTNTRYSLITTLAFAKSQAVTGTTINMITAIVQGMFAGAKLRLVFSNDTALGAAEGFTGILRVREVI